MSTKRSAGAIELQLTSPITQASSPVTTAGESSHHREKRFCEGSSPRPDSVQAQLTDHATLMSMPLTVVIFGATGDLAKKKERATDSKRGLQLAASSHRRPVFDSRCL